MSSLFQINRKIKSVKSISKITGALKVVSSNKSYLYKDLQKNSLPYLQGMYRIFFDVFNNPEHDIRTTNKYLISYLRDKNELWVVLGSDIGMCGDFNEKLKKYMSENFDDTKDGLVVVGTKLFNSLKRLYPENIEFNRSSEMSVFSIVDEIRKFTFEILDVFMSKHYQKLTLIYLKSPKEGILEKVNILPFTEKYFFQKKKVFVRNIDDSLTYPEAIVDLFPQYLECIFLGAIISSKLGEHTIRKELMHNATKNATDLMDEYTLKYNKLRQANITQEIVEIMAAVKSKRK